MYSRPHIFGRTILHSLLELPPFPRLLGYPRVSPTGIRVNRRQNNRARYIALIYWRLRV